MTEILLAAAGVLALALALRRFVEWIGVPCQFCQAKTHRFRRLDATTQAAILDYFLHVEHREPDRSGLFVCLTCRTVHDDFSGEKASWDVDAYGCVTFCKVCLSRIRGCEPDREARCPDCGTTYRWRRHEGSGFRFFTPPKDAKLSARRPSYMMDSR